MNGPKGNKRSYSRAYEKTSHPQSVYNTSHAVPSGPGSNSVNARKTAGNQVGNNNLGKNNGPVSKRVN